MKLSVTDHAIARYQERVKPALSRAQAIKELETLVAAAGEIKGRPEWLPPEHDTGDGYVEIADGVVGAVSRNHVTTVLVRAAGTPLHRRKKNERHQKRRRARAMRAKHKEGPGVKGSKRERDWHPEDME